MSFCVHDPGALAVDFEQVIISVILLTMFFANQIMICFTSAAHVLLVLSCLLNPRALAADLLLETGYCSGYLFPALFADQILIYLCQQHMCNQFHRLCIYGVWAKFEQVIVPVSLYLAPFVN